jgi:hypothetical protein
LPIWGSLGKDGMLTYNSSVLLNAAPTDFGNLTSFLGSTAGAGLLEAASDALSSAPDAETGLLPVSQSAVGAQASSLENRINDKQTKVCAWVRGAIKRGTCTTVVMEIDEQVRCTRQMAMVAALTWRASYRTSVRAPMLAALIANG